MKNKMLLIALIPFITFCDEWRSDSQNSISGGAGSGKGSYGINATAFGVGSAYETYQFENSVALGYLSAKSSIVSDSTILGTYAGFEAYGQYLTYIGCYSGTRAGNNIPNTHNTSIGYASSYHAQNQHSVIAIGSGTLRDSCSITNVIALGNEIGKAITGAHDRVWIDYTNESNPDNSSICLSPEKVGLGKLTIPVSIRGMLQDSVNPEYHYRFSSGTCSVYRIYNTYTTNWFLYDRTADVAYPVADEEVLVETNVGPESVTYSAPPYTLTSIYPPDPTPPAEGTTYYSILVKENGDNRDVLEWVDWSMFDEHLYKSDIPPVYIGFYCQSGMHINGYSHDLHLYYGYQITTHTDHISNIAMLSDIADLKTIIKNTVLSVPVVDTNEITQLEATAIMQSIRNTCVGW